MLDTLKWLFEGIGTELIGLVIGVVLGAAGGWNMHKRKMNISQRAGNYAHQNIRVEGKRDDVG